MTIAISWIRKLRECEELIIASDSRLSGGGRRFDRCPKITLLPRSDCAICFAGETDFAYPMMLQLSLAIDSHFRSKTRAMDITDLRKHVLKVFDSMKNSVHDCVEGLEKPEVSFIFAGYSWIYKRFEIWVIEYDSFANKFRYSSAKPILGIHGAIAFAGDVAGVAKKNLIQMIRKKAKSNPPYKDRSWDFEPFQVLRDMLREAKPTETIGGAPQIVKLYQHMNARALAVHWPNKDSGKLTLMGREVLGYEKIDNWILDPDTLISYSQLYSPVAFDPESEALGRCEAHPEMPESDLVKSSSPR